ncbi:SpoIIE family protein phosphatase [Nocardioides ferulae]|uniref:SpoIIE family protein phosphatase n=1 Tax=Nocardioides ferulae TaxID=2340821 RepID=UPI0013DE3442|nr:SpoIIE family protein phosphatase [Nocardioides ferulae]
MPLPENHVAQRGVRLAAEVTGADEARVWLVTDDRSAALDPDAAPEIRALASAAAESVLADEPVVLGTQTGGAVAAVPLRHGGRVPGALAATAASPGHWEPRRLRFLEQVAELVSADLRLASAAADLEGERLRWQLAVDAAEVGAFDWDLTTGSLLWDDRLLEIFGTDRSRFSGNIEAFYELVHPEDLPRVIAAAQQAVSTCGDYTAEYRVLRPDGSMRWVAARGRGLPGPDGKAVRLLGAAYDTTAVQEGEARVARVLESMPTAFYQLTPDWRFSYVNAEAERLLGATRGDLVGGSVWELFPAAVGSDFERSFRRAAETGEPLTFDAYYPAPLDGWFELRAWPSPDGLAVYFVDITQRRLVQESLDRTSRRNQLLAEVSTALSGTLEVEEAVGQLAELVVPALADWALVTVAGEDRGGDWRRRLHDVGWHHADPRLRPLVERYAALRLDALTEQSFLARGMRQTEPVLVTSGAATAIAEVLLPGEARDLCLRLAPESLAVVQLRARGRTVGLLSAFRDGSRAPFSAGDVDTLREVARRAALSLDNSRLYAEQRDLAEGLQRSMLTAPPESERLQIAVRYEPAAQAAQVGGDWYDAFHQGRGATMLVIGDVVGHDTAAAAAMGQVRGLLRGIAAHTGEGPAAVLRGVDQVMATLQVDTTATAIVARVEFDGPLLPDQPPGETSEPVRLRWANAGHPPPFAIHPSGEVTSLALPQADLLLGLDPATPRAETALDLPPGTAVLLYTDGLVERRGQPVDEGMARLGQLLRELGPLGLGLEELCDRVLAHMLPGPSEDDVALLAVRAGAG